MCENETLNEVVVKRDSEKFVSDDGLFYYLVRTFSRTNRKDYENYVLNAVWQGVVSRIPEKIKYLQPVTQQYAKRKDGKYGLIDLYFPQLRIAVECDEAYHSDDSQHIRDVDREDEINNQLKLLSAIDISDENNKIRFLRVDASKNFTEVTRNIANVIDEIVKSAEGVDLGLEYTRNPVELAHEKGSISVDDGFIFPTAWAVSECFNLGYKERMQELYMWTQNNQDVWCPLLTVENVDKKHANIGRTDWENYIRDEWREIWEKVPVKEGEIWQKGDVSWKDRITFAKARDSLGRNGYRFIGVYRFDRNDEESHSRVYRRVAKEIFFKDYPDLYSRYVEELRNRTKDGIIYDCSLDTASRYIRFKTSCIEKYFPEIDGFISKWGFKPYALYEINLDNKKERYTHISVKLWLSTHNDLKTCCGNDKICKLVTDSKFGAHKKYTEGWIDLTKDRLIIPIEDGIFSEEVIKKSFDTIFERITEFEKELTSFLEE